MLMSRIQITIYVFYLSTCREKEGPGKRVGEREGAGRGSTIFVCVRERERKRSSSIFFFFEETCGICTFICI